MVWFGTYANPGFIETVFLGIPAAGVPTILHRASCSDPTTTILAAVLLVLAAVNATLNELNHRLTISDVGPAWQPS